MSVREHMADRYAEHSATEPVWTTSQFCLRRCPLCQAAEANYAKAARELKTHDPPILLAKLDGSLEGPEILQK